MQVLVSSTCARGCGLEGRAPGGMTARWIDGGASVTTLGGMSVSHISPVRREGAARWLALLLLLPLTASAHTEVGAIGGLISGFKHPLSGLDHLVAMVAVGLWGAFLGGRAIWMLPVAFPMVMAFGGALGVMKVPLPAVETGIALSGVVLGLAVALAWKPAVKWAAVIVGVFGLLHGHAHGTELPEAANPMAYAVGFVVATGLLHLAGIAFGLLVKWPWGKIAVRVSGAVVALIGLGFLFNFL